MCSTAIFLISKARTGLKWTKVAVKNITDQKRIGQKFWIPQTLCQVCTIGKHGHGPWADKAYNSLCNKEHNRL